MSEVPGTSQRTQDHRAIPGVGSLIAIEDAEGNVYFYHMDPLGGIHRLTDIAQAVAKLYEFSPFGRILQETGSAPNEFVFPGTYLRLCDDGSLRVSPARVYDSALARFGSRDPSALKWGTPAYGYPGCSPIQNVDPSGLQGIPTVIDGKWSTCESCVLSQHPRFYYQELDWSFVTAVPKKVDTGTAPAMAVKYGNAASVWCVFVRAIDYVWKCCVDGVLSKVLSPSLEVMVFDEELPESEPGAIVIEAPIAIPLPFGQSASPDELQIRLMGLWSKGVNIGPFVRFCGEALKHRQERGVAPTKNVLLRPKLPKRCRARR